MHECFELLRSNDCSFLPPSAEKWAYRNNSHFNHNTLHPTIRPFFRRITMPAEYVFIGSGTTLQLHLQYGHSEGEVVSAVYDIFSPLQSRLENGNMNEHLNRTMFTCPSVTNFTVIAHTSGRKDMTWYKPSAQCTEYFFKRHHDPGIPRHGNKHNLWFLAAAFSVR